MCVKTNSEGAVEGAGMLQLRGHPTLTATKSLLRRDGRRLHLFSSTAAHASHSNNYNSRTPACRKNRPNLYFRH
ncbi:hypothetical protein E2C01_012650 [Portunus trituberculatus]|uniref:Uncharacterized protein n=1 Tax=Portunus trituberculatus TaxID=210409 RepID=A0A5B7DEQ2_PORTR|nr:hypothetical protein [Portunus trituberculatus]